MSLMVVDGTALLLRAWFAGADALAVSQSFLRKTSSPHRAVVFDAGLVTFRTHLDPRYKADRPQPGPARARPRCSRPAAGRPASSPRGSL